MHSTTLLGWWQERQEYCGHSCGLEKVMCSSEVVMATDIRQMWRECLVKFISKCQVLNKLVKMVKFMSPWGPKEEAQIQAVESYAKLPRNGVRIRHKCWVGDTPPLFATCPWAFLPSPPSKCLPSILRLPDSHTGQASPVYTYSFTSTAGPDLASRSWYIDGVFLHPLRLTWKWCTALLWWKWADSRDLWQPRVHSRFAFTNHQSPISPI